MEKNLLNPKIRDQLIDRIQQLEEHRQPKWGIMNAPQMLYHCRKLIAQSTGAFTAKNKINLFNKTLYRWFVLNMPWPKGRAQAHPEFRIVELGIIPQDLEKEKQLLIEAIHQFCQFQGPLFPHPMFGNFSHKTWGKLHFKHLDHHLKQFGR